MTRRVAVSTHRPRGADYLRWLRELGERPSTDPTALAVCEGCEGNGCGRCRNHGEVLPRRP